MRAIPKNSAMRIAFAVLPALCVLLSACGLKHRTSLLPSSGGRPYEVLLVGDTDRIVLAELQADAEALPQPEPSFDVSDIPSALYNQSVWLARAIVIVRCDATRYTETRLRYEKNLHAHPQMVVYVNTPSVRALRQEMPALGGQLRELLTRFEMNAEMEQLARGGNPRQEKTVNEVVGCSIRVPADMVRAKRARRFVWFATDSPTGMQNLCVYTLQMHPLSLQWIAAQRDSVMRANLPGERPGMYVQTVEETLSARIGSEKGGHRTIVRGLWEMKDDAMGGPFVAHIVADTAHSRYVVAEAFVYAPEMRKRNKMRQTEAALYTLKVK